MTDKTVTYADLERLREMRSECTKGSLLARALDVAIAVAEADTPPLPEGWVLHFDGGHWHPYWHERDHLYECKDVDGGACLVEHVGEGAFTRDRLTPLRPTVTEADVEKAAEALRADFHNYAEDVVGWSRAASDVKRSWIKNARAAFTAAGVVIEP